MKEWLVKETLQNFNIVYYGILNTLTLKPKYTSKAKMLNFWRKSKEKNSKHVSSFLFIKLYFMWRGSDSNLKETLWIYLEFDQRIYFFLQEIVFIYLPSTTKWPISRKIHIIGRVGCYLLALILMHITQAYWKLQGPNLCDTWTNYNKKHFGCRNRAKKNPPTFF